MKEIVETTHLEFDKSSFLIDLVRHDNGQLYIEITQKNHVAFKEKNSIKINPAVLTDIQKVLQTYQAKIPRKQIGEVKHLTDKQQQTIVTNYLKGVTIINLAMQYDQDPELIEQVIRNKGIDIVDNDLNNAKKTKWNRRWRKAR
jgi:hypothetical protein